VYRRVREDRDVNDGSWLSPGFQAVCVYRFGAWLRAAPRAVRWPGDVLYVLLFTWVRNFYGIELPRTASIGRRLRISHQHGVIVHPHAVIGDDCVIRHNVTVGGVLSHHDGPRLGNRVDVAVGAVILGRVTIGDDARIGPNAVVTTNVPEGATAFAMPARVIPARACRAAAPER
jgi:serine O-acetyltransferase